MLRTHTCGELNRNHIDEPVKLTGWLQRSRDLGGLLFLDLRDRYGLVQIVIDPSVQESLAEKAKKITRESVILVQGTIHPRPPEMVNPDMQTGEIEIHPDNIETLSTCAELPIPIDEIIDAGEELRLKYRYLELRRPSMQKNLEIRHHTAQTVRNHLAARNFWEIETPCFMKSTPEGARDFLVPSRLNKGRFYALPQSPQTYKQLLMVAGMDKYFQIVRCFRDEDFRADRQPEFTQIDVEMSFVDEEDIFALTEALIADIYRTVGKIAVPPEFPRLTYARAIDHYGTDKPDTSFAWQLQNLSDSLNNTGFKVFDQALQGGGVVYALPLEDMELSRKKIDQANEFAREFGLPGVVAAKFTDDGLNAPLGKILSPDKIAQLKTSLLQDRNGTVLFAAGKYRPIVEALGKLRLKLADEYQIDRTPPPHFLWVTDFPLFEEDDAGHLTSSHHPFTAPLPEDVALLDSDPLKVHSRAYDLVIDGYEIASGSVRIHRREIQERIFELLGVSPAQAEEKFGFLLKAFEYGVPPHAGIAFGFDRLVMLLCGKKSIREIIPFPKTTSGLSLMDGAPASIDPAQLKELGLKLSD